MAASIKLVTFSLAASDFSALLLSLSSRILGTFSSASGCENICSKVVDSSASKLFAKTWLFELF